MEFKPGDIIECIQPTSGSGVAFDLKIDTPYKVKEYSTASTIKLVDVGHLSYRQERFVKYRKESHFDKLYLRLK